MRTGFYCPPINFIINSTSQRPWEQKGQKTRVTPYSTPSKHSLLFLHLTISRLRSYLPHALPTSVTSANLAFRGVSPSPVPSSFSTLSPGSSSSANIPLPGTTDVKGDFAQTNEHDSSDAHEVF